MTQARLTSNAPSPQMLPQTRSRLAMSSVRLKLCSTERRDGLWRKNLFMLQAIWQLRPVLGVQVRTQRYGIRVNASRASTRQRRRQSALRRPRRPRLLGGELEGPGLLVSLDDAQLGDVETTDGSACEVL